MITQRVESSASPSANMKFLDQEINSRVGVCPKDNVIISSDDRRRRTEVRLRNDDLIRQAAL